MRKIGLLLLIIFIPGGCASTPSYYTAAPHVSLHAWYTGTYMDSVEFTAYFWTASRYDYRSPYRYQQSCFRAVWDFGDGSPHVYNYLGPNWARYTLRSSHTYRRPGMYRVRLTVYDMCRNRGYYGRYTVHISPHHRRYVR